MHVITANLWNGMTSDQRKADASAVFADPNVTNWPIVLWQELKTSAMHDDVKAVEPAGSYHAFSGCPLGVTIPTDKYEVLEEVIHPTLDADTVLPDAARYFAVLKLRAKFRTTADKFYLINTHMTANCDWGLDLSTIPDGAEKDEYIARRNRWTLHFNLMRDEIDRIKHVGTVNKTCIWGGDFNRGTTMPQFASNEKLATPNNYIDRLVALDRNIVTTKLADGVITLPTSDHDARWADWRLTSA